MSRGTELFTNQSTITIENKDLGTMLVSLSSFMRGDFLCLHHHH
jgi:hypothetical protein